MTAAAEAAWPMQTVDTSRPDDLHGVVDGEQGGHVAAGGVDVEADVLVGVLGLEVEELGDEQVGHVLVELAGEEDDPLLQQAGVDVEGPLAAAGSARGRWAPAGSWVGLLVVQPNGCTNGSGVRGSDVQPLGCFYPGMIDRLVRRTVTLDASIDEVWRLLIDADELAGWLGTVDGDVPA